MRMLDLFSGIGGISLAAEWAGIETVAFCEIESFPQKVLRKNWPDVPIFEDVEKLSKKALIDEGVIDDERTIDIICGGYPCQPFSHAGKRGGKEDDRHLWPEMFRLIKEIRPAWIVGENVAGHISLGLDDVLADLEGEGYQARAFVLPAASVGAPHRRDRVFIVADSESQRCTEAREHQCHRSKERASSSSEEGLADSKRNAERGLSLGTREKDARFACCSKDVANSSGSRWKEQHVSTESDSKGYITGCSAKGMADTPSFRQSGPREFIKPLHSEKSREWKAGRSIDVRIRKERPTQSRMGGMLDGISEWLDRHQWPAGLGQEQFGWEPPRVATGAKDRVGRLKGLGNAVVPQQIYPFFLAIKTINDIEVRGLA
ncbi:DNA (cytosine-5-)-methyltransferase [Aneurinibacillus sp. Ricciae_BoGa-3]|uniref:DNA cytosine methyltransferase n=1 Tax=Aneurinibacillus sp. Ricciae_BoGa-3 TaxID=3022697 RepID=UPI002341F32C|nr:DNA (cytosine-5-)-methyltransferase [Aneurinibacillus sp. Ricciae_BoGa-3]WCK53857.1 DNA (cytosine-5-)-methyltransferase [Aneurinibacillus sp. Ricciae_BoGa-3]